MLSNPASPGLLKIGFTTHTVEERAARLSAASGVVKPFQIEYWRLTLNADEVEDVIHDHFKHCRVNGKREFFAADVDEVIAEIDSRIQEPPSRYRRVPPKPKQAEVRLSSCNRCGHMYSKSRMEPFCPACGF